MASFFKPKHDVIVQNMTTVVEATWLVSSNPNTTSLFKTNLIIITLVVILWLEKIDHALIEPIPLSWLQS